MTKAIVSIITALSVITCVSAAAEPELPRTYVDSTYTSSWGASIYVPVGASLQMAIDKAQPGDTILLEPGAEYRGAFVLRPKNGEGWITIQTLAYSQLPGADSRITRDYFVSLPKIITVDSRAAITVAAGANKYRLVGLEITSEAPMTWGIVQIFGGSNVVIDRCYVHGHSTQSNLQGVLVDGTAIAVVNSHIEEIHWPGGDSQGIGGSKTNGPIKIVNNFISAAGETVMFGGARSPVPGTIPSDIEIRNNHFFKDPSWMGGKWTIKNHLEFKNAQRALVEGNVFENTWQAAQLGYAILFTVSTVDSGDWAIVDDITFRNNTLRNVQGGFSLNGYDPYTTTGFRGETKRVRISNNSIALRSATDSVGITWNRGTADIQFDHNTFGPKCRFSMFFQGVTAGGPNNSLSNNLLCTPPLGDAMGWGSATLQKFIPDPAPLESRFTKNVILVESPVPMKPHPANNLLVPEVMFVSADLKLADRPEYAGVGANIDQLRVLAEAAISGKGSIPSAVVIGLDRSSLGASEQTYLRAFLNGQPVAAEWTVYPSIGTIASSPTPAFSTQMSYTAPLEVSTNQILRLCARTVGLTTAQTCTTLALKASPTMVLNASTFVLAAGQRVQFTATMTNAASGTMWRIEPAAGAITSTGLYTAPDQVPSLLKVKIIATSTTVAGLSKTAEITLQPPQVGLAFSAVTLFGGQQLAVRATVTGSTDKRLLWTLQPAIGQIDESGVYTTPPSVAEQKVVQVTAKLMTNPAISATAQIRLRPLTISITPERRSLFVGQSVVMVPVVNSTTDKRVQWTVSPHMAGSFDTATGIYTHLAAPGLGQSQQVAITATSVADPTKIGRAVITLIAPRVKIAVSDSLTLRPGEKRVFTVSIYDDPSFESFTWSITPNAGTFDVASGLYTAPAEIKTATQVQFTATSVVDPRQSATVVFSLLP